MRGPVLASQLRSPLLILLAVTALASAFLGQASDAVIIGVILAASVGLGFVNEYKAAKTAEALHSSVRHSCVALRDGHPRTVDVTELVPGDVVDLQLGQVVPADLRLLAVAGLECDESVLTGESLPAEKSAEPVAAGTPLAELSCCALMGTVVRAGSGTGVVVATGGDAFRTWISRPREQIGRVLDRRVRTTIVWPPPPVQPMSCKRRSRCSTTWWPRRSRSATPTRSASFTPSCHGCMSDEMIGSLLYYRGAPRRPAMGRDLYRRRRRPGAQPPGDAAARALAHARASAASSTASSA